MVTPVLLQTLLEGLHTAHTAVLRAGQEADPPLPHVLLRQQRRKQGGQTASQLTEVIPALQHQPT